MYNYLLLNYYINMKYTLNEEQLAQIIANSARKIIQEELDEKGIGGFLGGALGKIKNGFKRFGDNFFNSYNNNYNTGSVGQANTQGTTNQNGGNGGGGNQPQNASQIIQQQQDTLENLATQITDLKGQVQNSHYNGIYQGMDDDERAEFNGDGRPKPKPQQQQPQQNTDQGQDNQEKQEEPDSANNWGANLMKQGIANYGKGYGQKPNYMPNNTMSFDWKDKITYENRRSNMNTTSKKVSITEERLNALITETISKKFSQMSESQINKMISKSVKKVLKEEQENTYGTLIDIMNRLDMIINSSFIPFSSPSPSSTEKKVADSIIQANELLKQAAIGCKELGYGI